MFGEKGVLVAHNLRAWTELEELSLGDLRSDLRMARHFMTLRGEVLQDQDLLTPPLLWSGRISTGLFGTVECRSGKRGPGGNEEVIFGVGAGGLRGIIDLGFLPCPTCRDGWQTNFPGEEMVEITEEKYGLEPERLFNQQVLPFDGRRVNYERIAVAAGSLPDRVYVPKDLDSEAIGRMKERFSSLPRRHAVTVGSYVRGGIEPYFILR